MAVIFNALSALVTETLPPQTKWNPVEDMPNLAGRVFIVTGANTGVGYEAAKALVNADGKVYVACRDAVKANKAIEDIKKATGKDDVHLLELDLSDLPAIRRAAEAFLAKESELHALINNAGVMFPPIEMLTKQGYDLQFGTNVLGHYQFTMLLLPALIKSAASSPGIGGRVVNVSSSATIVSRGIRWNTLKDDPSRRKYGTQLMYVQSKMGNVLFSNELARRYGDQGIVSCSMNPGNLSSDLGRHTPAWQWWLVGWVHFKPAFGAISELWAATAPEGAVLNGKYVIPWARTGWVNPNGTDEGLARKLWGWMEQQVEGH